MRYHRTALLGLVLCSSMSVSSQKACAQIVSGSRYAQGTSSPIVGGKVEALPIGTPGSEASNAPTGSPGYTEQGFAPDRMYPAGSDAVGGYADGCCDAG